MNKLTLHTPLTINGKAVTELSYDANAITVEQFAEADARKLKATTARSNGNNTMCELDYSFQMYLGMMAVIAANPEIDISDLERMTGLDIVGITRVGRNFILGKSEEPFEESSSGEPCETTPEPSTPRLETSKKDG